MQNPFPGMNPYLEDATLWGDVHHLLISHLARELNRELPDDYYASIEERVYLESPSTFRQIVPDIVLSKPVDSPPRPSTTAVVADPPTRIEVAGDPVREAFIQIFALRNQQRLLVGVIEILSPTNKTPHAEGRKRYLEKQQELLRSTAHLMEIDLLHYGEHTVFLPREVILREGEWDYLIALHRAGWSLLKGDIWRVQLPDRLPRVSIPLLHGDGEVVVDLQQVLNRTYEEGRFHKKVDYSVDPPVPLPESKLQWVRTLLRERGLRP
jgi:hypothetical protein